jgi:uncharacterized damage-inducible protein DinB
MTETETQTQTPERADLLDVLRKHRGLFLATVSGLTDEQARARPTVSELTLGGLVKHVSTTEQGWARFIANGPDRGADIDWGAVDWSNPPEAVLAYQDGFRMSDDETLAELLERYAGVAAATDALVREVDLDASQPLPDQPWFEPGSRWTARRVFLHIAVETSQHAGHADIIRESIDGQKTMG